MKATILVIALMLCGCATLTKDDVVNLIAIGLATRGGYNYQAEMAKSQAYTINNTRLPRYNNIICNQYGTVIRCTQQTW